MSSPCAIGGMLILAMTIAWAAEADGQTRPAEPSAKPDPGRVKEIAAMLSAEPVGAGRGASDRPTWEAIGRTDRFADVISAAAKRLGTPCPVVTAEDFDSYEKTGRRQGYGRAFLPLHRRYVDALYAECIENRGRFVADIEQTIAEICRMPTWVPPYHHGLWKRDKDTPYIVDLISSDLAAALATGDYWLKDKLSERTRKLLRQRIEERIFEPVRSAAEGQGKRRIWWIAGSNNWNSVCWANVVISALTLRPDRQERAYFIAAAEKAMKFYLGGFTSDGYCSEGLGYWNYGFSNYVKLADAVFQATGGKIDMMEDPLVRRIAAFGTRLRMLPTVYPTIADGRAGGKPTGSLQNYISRKYKLHLTSWHRPLGAEAMTRAPNAACFAFPYGLDKPLADGPFKLDPAREWFEQAQFYIGRPGGGEARIAVACKGGHNAEHHNHNDVGTYLVAIGRKTPLVDPGAPVYTRKTFSEHRYEDELINSWGHPVPLVDGRLQQTGKQAKAKALEVTFTDGEDRLVFDITSAYPVDELKKLTRTFVYSRAGEGSLTVTDRVEFDQPKRFGTALITFGKCAREGDGLVRITDDTQSLLVKIDTGGLAYEITDKRIDSEVRGRRKPIRVGIDLAEKVASAEITVRITPGEG